MCPTIWPPLGTLSVLNPQPLSAMGKTGDCHLQDLEPLPAASPQGAWSSRWGENPWAAHR